MTASPDDIRMARAHDMGVADGVTRRGFLAGCAAGLSALAAGPSAAHAAWDRGPKMAPPGEEHLVEARYYDKLADRKIRCTLCPRECVIDDLERGYCGVRENREGTYYTLVHSRPCTWHVDPIEKKPFYHVLPGTDAYSIATVGCNVECKFCQNWQISQVRPEQVRNYVLSPKELAQRADRSGARSVAYTYTEPVIYFEYMLDGARACRERGVRNVMVSGGYIKRDPLVELCEVLDAVKIDLKAYTETFYEEQCSGELKPVLDTLELLVENGVWTEIVYLVIPTLNDSEEELTGVCKWVRGSLGPDVPIHFTRFHPDYRLRNLPRTPIQTLNRAVDIGRAAGLRYVYVGNVPGHSSENTVCPTCGAVLIERRGYATAVRGVSSGACTKCAAHIPGVWE
ncbi:MAG: AmmeMemoRadiSam system radical SAM enzyme [Candidatus Latescibacteria bacterium]|nr:AmmeMemoRadiSam system radical SAM enzyme [Candidatus Latescibacterota bacterium]